MRVRKYRKKDVPKLQYGIIHSQFGLADGVSIVMKQIEEVLTKQKDVPLKNIHYLVGKSGTKRPTIIADKLFWDKYPSNMVALKNFEKGFGGSKSELLEHEIHLAKLRIQHWVEKNNIDVIIAHNTSMPVNFITSVALHRYYRDIKKQNKVPPKYILWWHDSHQERDHFSRPAPDVEEYLIHGIPGEHVEYFIFINSLQITQAEKYFQKLDERKPGFFQRVQANHDVVYNTTDTFIDSYTDLQSTKYESYVESFVKDFKVRETLAEKNVRMSDTLFVLQHTRIVERKRIDFALEYSFALLAELKKKKIYRSLYFFISGYDHDGLRRKLKAQKRKLEKQYGIDTFFLVFVNDAKTKLVFEEYPHIFAKLGGLSTYFSEIEGFGNNLLEVLASGLIPILYTYPVFKKDIAKYKLKVIALDDFVVDQKSIEETVSLLKSTRKQKLWINKNIAILKKRFPHQIIARKLTRAIIRKRDLS